MLIFTYINCHYNPVGNKMRRHSHIDHLITYFDTCLRFFPTIHQTNELAIPPNIIRDNNDNDLSYSEKNSSISMLRINHCGEVCAQALYQAQAIFAKAMVPLCTVTDCSSVYAKQNDTTRVL